MKITTSVNQRRYGPLSSEDDFERVSSQSTANWAHNACANFLQKKVYRKFYFDKNIVRVKSVGVKMLGIFCLAEFARPFRSSTYQ